MERSVAALLAVQVTDVMVPGLLLSEKIQRVDDESDTAIVGGVDPSSAKHGVAQRTDKHASNPGAG